MKTWLSKNKKIALMVISIGMVVCLLAVALPTMSAFAASPQQSATPPAPTTPAAPTLNADSNLRLERLYQAELKAQDRQARFLVRSDQLVQKAQDLINRLKARGVNTTPLETALSTFQTSLASAREMHQNAAGILQAHAGFDANGKVIDRPDAMGTILSAGESQREVRFTLRLAFRDLRLVVWAYIKASFLSPRS